MASNTGSPRSLADLAPNSVKVTTDEPVKIAPDVTPAKRVKTPPTPQAQSEEYVDGIYIFNSEHDLNHAERAFYLKRRKKYLEEYSLNDSSDMGIIHRIIMEEILGERVYTQVLENPGNPILGQQLTESNKRYQAALDNLGASRDKRIRNRESGGVSIADLAKTYYDERKTVFAVDKSKRDMEDQAVEEQQQEFFAKQFGAIQQSGILDSSSEDLEDEV